MAVHRTERAEQALAATRGFLESEPVRNNVLLSVLAERARRPESGVYWWVTSGGRVRAVALRSPPGLPAVLAPALPEHLEPLVDRMAHDLPDLAGVLGETSSAAAFAGRWAELTGRPVSPVEGQRLYVLGELRIPDAPAGRLRPADDGDRDRLVAWVEDFLVDTSTGGGQRVADVVEARLADGRLWVWEEAGTPVAMAQATEPLAGAVRIGYVYTPPEHRRHGRGAMIVASLSARMLASEAVSTCLLYTQLTNPTSNAIYRRIGYRPVAEVLRYRFGAPPPTGGT